MFAGTANANGPARPFRPYKGVGIAQTSLVPHPTRPAPWLLFTATEIGQYTHMGRATVVTMKADFNPLAVAVENGVSAATAADKSKAFSTWFGGLGPDGRFVGTVTWSGGTKRFKYIQGTSTFISTPIGPPETTNIFRNDHSGRVSY